MRGLYIFLFPSYWSVARTVDLLHFTFNVQTQEELVGYALAKWKKNNVTDFLWLSSSAVFQFMWFFSSLVPFPVHDAIQAITSFIWTAGQSASSFSSCMSHVTLPIFLKAGLKEGESPGFRDSLPCSLFNKAEWSLTSWTDVQNQLPASHSWYFWPVQNGQIYYSL